MTRLEFIRRSRGWTQKALSEALGDGFTTGSVSLIETGRLRPSQKQAQRLRSFFARPVNVLLEPVVENEIAR